MNTKAWAFAAALLAAGSAQAACYSVYTAKGGLIQEGSTAPVNMTLPLGDTVPEKFGPGATMTVSDLGVFCKDRRGEGNPLKTPAAAAREEAAKARKVAASAEQVAAQEPAPEAR